MIVIFFFFFKQKTAYEMRISDWSSDVCSSDLLGELNERSGQFVLKCALVGSCGGQRIGCTSTKMRCPSDRSSYVISRDVSRHDLCFHLAALPFLRLNRKRPCFIVCSKKLLPDRRLPALLDFDRLQIVRAHVRP